MKRGGRAKQDCVVKCGEGVDEESLGKEDGMETDN